MSFDLQVSANDRCGLNVPDNEPPPRLSITRGETNVVILWPATCARSLYVLEQITALDEAAEWEPVGIAAQIVNGQYQMSVSLQHQQVIYRLRRP